MVAVRTNTGDINPVQCPNITSSSYPLRRNINPIHNLPERRPSIRSFNWGINRPRMTPINQSHHYPYRDARNAIHQSLRTLPTRYALLSVMLIFATSLVALTYVYMSFPDLEENEKQYIKLPWDIEEAKHLGIVLDRYKERYYYEVLSGVFVSYVFLQTFAIPGSLFLSILSGFLFPFVLALVLVCVCSALGASLCYLLSQLLGRRLVQRFFPERAEKWAIAVHKHRDNIFNYILFLRMTPFLPNWFINLVAPVIGVPLVPFALGTFLGVGPPSFVAIQAGQTLYKMTSTSDTWSWTSMFLLAFFALVSLIPVFLKKRLRDKFE